MTRSIFTFPNLFDLNTSPSSNSKMSEADHQIYRGYIFPFAMPCDQVTAAAVRMLLSVFSSFEIRIDKFPAGSRNRKKYFPNRTRKIQFAFQTITWNNDCRFEDSSQGYILLIVRLINGLKKVNSFRRKLKLPVKI